MLKRRGASYLGIQVDWQYEFLGHGTPLSPRLDTVALDIGNRLEPGVLDTHQDGSLADSTAMLVLNRSELVYDHLLEPWLRRADDGLPVKGKRWAPIITTHSSPDLDAVVSALLVQELVMNGRLPDWAKSLAEFSAEVDQGRWKLSRDLPDFPYRMKCVALVFYGMDEPTDGGRMKLGIKLLRAEAQHLRDSNKKPNSKEKWLKPEDWYGEHAGAWASCNEKSREIESELKEDRKIFEREKSEGLFDDPEVTLPVAETGGLKTMKVKATVVKDKKGSESKLLKYWVRGPKCPMLIWPRYVEKKDASGDRKFTVAISLDPNFADATGQKPTLKGLGPALELLEQKERKASGKTDKRSGSRRFEDAKNNDPWYDGRGHEYGIVDSPRSGTEIPYEEIRRCATNGSFWQRELSLTIRVHRICRREIPPKKNCWLVKTNPETTSLPEKKEKPDALESECRKIFEELRIRPNAKNEQRASPESSFWDPIEKRRPKKLNRTSLKNFEWPTISDDFYIEETEWAITNGAEQDIREWIEEIRNSDSSVFFSICYKRDEKPSGNAQQDRKEIRRTEEENAALLLGLPLEKCPDYRVAEGLFCSGRETFYCPPREEGDQRWEDVCATQLVIAMYHGLLSHLLPEDVEKAGRFGGAKKAKAAKQLAKQINHVLERYDVHEVSGVVDLQQMFRMMRRQTGLEPMTARARHKADALDSVVEKHQGQNIEFFLFILGLMGLTQTVTALEDLTTLDWVYWSGTSLAAVVGVLWGLYLFGVFRRE